MKHVRDIGWAVVLLLGLVTSAFAQGTGDIVGRVTDASGGVLPGVTVTVTNRGTNIARTAVTSETGDYAFTLLPIGVYEVRAELSGFGTQRSTVNLATGDRARVDAKLEVGGLSETLTVSGDAPLLQTDTSRVYGPSTLEILPEIVAAVDHRVPVLTDSGYRSGTDILKALALGADAVLLGRTTRWALGAFGAAGVQKLLAMMQDELIQAAAATGRTTRASIDGSIVRTRFS